MVDFVNISWALGQSPLNEYCKGSLEPRRKLFVIGPQRPCGSIAKGKRIMSCLIRSPMTSSPIIVEEGSEEFIFVLRLYFLHSNFWICLSAKAVKEGIAISSKLSVGVFALWVIVMSAPKVAYGQGMCDVSDVLMSGLNDMSKGLADMSLVLISGLSISMCVLLRMYSAVVNAGCNACAQVSRMMLCAAILLMFLHLKV